MSFYNLPLVHNILQSVTFILILASFAGCSDEMPVDYFDTSTISNEGEQTLKASVESHTILVWGDNTFGQISNAPGGKIKEIAQGGSINGLALRWDKTPVLWGTGPIGPAAINEALSLQKFLTVALGRDDGVMIRLDHTLAGFGENELITNVPSGFYKAVTVSSIYAVAITEDGMLKAWGNDSYYTANGLVTGLLNSPGGGPFIAVDAKGLHSLALHEDGTLYGWGHPSHGINIFEGWIPVPENQNIFHVPYQKFKAISAGNIHALAIRSDGSITGWGYGAGGALDAPSHVLFKAVAAGWGYSIGLSTEGTLWGWGTPQKNPFASEGWTFESIGWTRYGNTNHFYVRDLRFASISAAAFHLEAIISGN